MQSSTLLTGASGFLGRHVEAKFRQEGIPVITLGRASHSQIQCDLAREVPDFGTASIDRVVHAAGKAHVVPSTEAEALDFKMVNTTGTENLLKGLEKLSEKPKHFCFISTVAVYGVEAGMAITETQHLAGNTPYAQSKILAEQLVEAWCRKHQVACYILRLPLIAGKGAPGNLETMVAGIRTGRYWNIGGGTAQKSMVLAEDVSTAILQMEGHPGIYHLTDGQHPSFSALAALMAKQLGKPAPGNIPLGIAKCMAMVGDLLGKKAPINSLRLQKITASLTFNDELARQRWGWSPKPVLAYYEI